MSRTIISTKGESYGCRSRFKKELLDELLAGQDAKAVFEKDGLLDELKKALAERILNAEMDHHLGQDGEQAAGNHRNGYEPEDGADRHRQARAGDSAGSPGPLRAGADRQVPTALPRLRREDHRACTPGG